VLIDYFLKRGVEDCVIVAPDAGRANRARGFARRLGDNLPLAIIDKRRPEPNRAEVVHVVGDVEGLDAIIFDDMIDTGGTLVSAAAALKERGATSVTAVATHGILSGPAIERIGQSDILEGAITDTIDLPLEKQIRKIRVLSVSSLLADAIIRTHRGESVSSLFI
jgi:ribose-phosphate pyrophosphokinase